jgi:hypothetical protein
MKRAKALQKLKKYKAAGHDRVPAELLKTQPSHAGC